MTPRSTFVTFIQNYELQQGHNITVLKGTFFFGVGQRRASLSELSFLKQLPALVKSNTDESEAKR